MVFNEDLFMAVALIVFAVWLSVLTFLFVRMIWHYNRLASAGSKAGLRDVLDNLWREHDGFKRRVGEMEEGTERLAAIGTLHIQRIGIVRFNPFADTGGAQSFAMAILDGADNGIVMTSLYTRAGNRWYVKEVVGGKGKEFELSKEEQEAIDKAKQIKKN